MPLHERDCDLIAAALSAPRRLQILKEIGSTPEPYPCTSILQSQRITAATISHHLKELERAGLIEVFREGKYLNVALRRDTLNAYAEYLKAI